MRRGPRQLLRRLGIDIARYPLHSTLHGHLLWLLDNEHVTTVLDVGANHGQFAQKLRNESRFKGRITSFEPFPESREILEESARNDHWWTSLPFALGDRDDQLELLTFEGSDWNSLHAPDDTGLAASGREGEPSLADTLAAVADHGFAPTGFFPVARSKNSLALTTVDVCFVRTHKP